MIYEINFGLRCAGRSAQLDGYTRMVQTITVNSFSPI